jgi:uncharacterized protein involved in exopolysaccharide biosynthesis
MSVFYDPSKSSPANPAARPFSRSDYETAPRANAPVRTLRDSEPVATVTLDKIGDFLELDFRRLFVWLRAGLFAAVGLAVIGAIGGGAYAILAKARYTVGTDILIDPANLQVVANDLYSQPGQVDGQVLNAGSKLRVLTSRNVLAHVVDELDLTRDPEFFDPTPGLLSELIGTSANAPKPDPKLAAIDNLEKRVSTIADDKSFVATLSVSAQTPDKAIRISQAMVKSFQEELAKGDAEGANRAAAALDDRLGQLKSDVQVAEDKVESFKRSHGLSSSDGQLVSSQTMTQLNSQIVAAQSRLIAAQAGYDAVAAAGGNASSADPVAAAALVALRTKAGNLQQQLDALSMTYGRRHPAIVRLDAELAAANAQIKAELARTLDAAKATLDKAKASLKALTSKMDDLKGSVFTENESQVPLRQLERDAASKTAIYESFLSRAHQITEQEQIDTTNVRVISNAVPPAGRSWPPRTMLMMLAGAIAGFALGMLFALGRGILRDLRQPPGRVGNTGIRA